MDLWDMFKVIGWAALWLLLILLAWAWWRGDLRRKPSGKKDPADG